MGILEQIFSIAKGVAGQLLSPQISVYWGYLLSATVIAAAVHLARSSPRDRFSLVAWLGHLLPRRIWTHPSVRHDLAIFVINTLLYSFLFLGPLQTVSSAVHAVASALLPETPAPAVLPGWCARLLVTLGVFIVADFAFFVAHLAMHRIGALWEFHKIHHSAPVLQPFTVFRRHPVDVVLESTLSGLLLGITYALLGWLLGGQLSAFEILGTNAALFICLVAGFNLQHSHIWLSFGRLDAVFISPATHQIHHSSDPRHHDRNFGNMLAIWDGIAGTLVRPRGYPELTFGLSDGEERDYGTLFRLYLLPLVRAFTRMFGRSGAQSPSASTAAHQPKGPRP